AAASSSCRTAASSSCRTYAHTYRTKPNLGRTCASLAGAKPDAYGSCTARRAERGSAERLKDRLAIDRARHRTGLIKLCTYRYLECGPDRKKNLAFFCPSPFVRSTRHNPMANWLT